MIGESILSFVSYENKKKCHHTIKPCCNVFLAEDRDSSRLGVNGITIFRGNNCYHSNPFKIARGITQKDTKSLS